MVQLPFEKRVEMAKTQLSEARENLGRILQDASADIDAFAQTMNLPPDLTDDEDLVGLMEESKKKFDDTKSELFRRTQASWNEFVQDSIKTFGKDAVEKALAEIKKANVS